MTTNVTIEKAEAAANAVERTEMCAVVDKLEKYPK
jgi:hypothetical protein